MLRVGRGESVREGGDGGGTGEGRTSGGGTTGCGVFGDEGAKVVEDGVG